ncbi:hypothetical protein H5300_21690, partial [Vibrio sp. SG41-7]|nr:hypothetical protein [Vibrio sp. SG41-7]
EKLKEQNVQLIASAADVAQAIIFTTVPEGEGLYFDKDGNPVEKWAKPIACCNI